MVMGILMTPGLEVGEGGAGGRREAGQGEEMWKEHSLSLPSINAEPRRGHAQPEVLGQHMDL